MAKKFWLFSLLILICFISSPVFAASCTNGTWTKAWRNTDNQWITFTANPYDTPYNATGFYFNFANSNIKNTNWTLEQLVIYRVNLLAAKDPTVQVLYGTTSNYVNIASYCSIGITSSVSGVEVQYTVNVSCNYTGTNSSANNIRINILNIADNMIQSSAHIYHQNQCLKITPSDTDKILSDIQSGVNDVNSNINNAKNNINSNITDSTANIISNVNTKINEVKSQLQVTPSGQFVIDSSTAQSVEQKEGMLRSGLLDPYQDGNLDDYISSGPTTTEYTNGMSYLWSIITNLIGPNSVLWILTSMILTLGIIRLVLSR